jgi:hypothetical protein
VLASFASPFSINGFNASGNHKQPIFIDILIVSGRLNLRSNVALMSQVLSLRNIFKGFAKESLLTQATQKCSSQSEID